MFGLRRIGSIKGKCDRTTSCYFILPLGYLLLLENCGYYTELIHHCLRQRFQVMYLSKMTAAILDDLDYIVDGSAVSLNTAR